MSLLALISGASSAIAAKTAALETAMDSAFASSPLGDISDSFNNSALGKAVKMGESKEFNNFGGSGGMQHHSQAQAGGSNYADATGQMQGVMSQAGISDPMAGMLRGGSEAFGSMPPLAQMPTQPSMIQTKPAPSQAPELDEIDALEADTNTNNDSGYLYEPAQEFDYNPAMLAE
jgi:hypothetical protein